MAGVSTCNVSCSMFLISSLTFHVRLSRRWAFFCQSLSEISIAVQQLDEVGREVKFCTHVGGGHYVRLVLRGLSQMVPTAISKRPETDEKTDRSEPGSMGANEKARRGDKQRSSHSRHGATVLHARRPPPHVRMSRVQSIAEARIKSSNPFVLDPIERDSNVLADACRSFYTTLPRSSYPSKSGTPTSMPVVNVCPGTRCSTTTAHRVSFIVIRTLLKLSSISNSKTIVKLVFARARACVCMRVHRFESTMTIGNLVTNIVSYV